VGTKTKQTQVQISRHLLRKQSYQAGHQRKKEINKQKQQPTNQPINHQPASAQKKNTHSNENATTTKKKASITKEVHTHYLQVPPLKLKRFSTHSISSIRLGELSLSRPPPSPTPLSKNSLSVSKLVAVSWLFAPPPYPSSRCSYLPLFLSLSPNDNGGDRFFPIFAEPFPSAARRWSFGSGGGENGVPGSLFSLSESREGSKAEKPLLFFGRLADFLRVLREEEERFKAGEDLDCLVGVGLRNLGLDCVRGREGMMGLLPAALLKV
jgi:hypothetical protein